MTTAQTAQVLAKASGGELYEIAPDKRYTDADLDWSDEQAGKRFDYIASIIMVDNWLPNFDMNEQILIDKHIPENPQKIAADLAGQRRWHEPVTELEREQHREFLARTGLDPAIGFALKSENCFTVTDACIDCGVCVAVCPRGNYELTYYI